MTLFGVTFALLAAGCSAYWAVQEYRRTKEIFTPWLLMLVYAILDVFLAAAVFLLAGPPDFPSWIAPLEPDGLATAPVVHSLALLLFAAGYFLMSGRTTGVGPSQGRGWSSLATAKIKVKPIYAALVVTGGWYFLYRMTLVREAGSFDAYLADNFRNRLRLDPYAAEGLSDFVFNQFAAAMLPAFMVLVGTLFFFRYRYGRPFLWGIVLPTVGWLFTTATFFRGTQMHFFLSLAFLEVCRIRVERLQSGKEDRGAPGRAAPLLNRRSRILAATAILLFVSYGAFRHYNSSFQYGKPISVREALTAQGGEFTRGWGLVGLTSILDFYSKDGHQLGGSSLTEALIRPIPRLFWPEKPERYGGEAVTRRMGWLTTTQSAITMPGELYANFGASGIVLSGAFGIFFGAVYRRRLNPKFFFVYPFFVPQAVLLTHWMAFSGLMTSLTLYPVAAVVTWLVVVPARQPERIQEAV